MLCVSTSFLEKIIETIHIPTNHYDSTILSALSFQITVRALFNLGFNLVILIFATLLFSVVCFHIILSF